MSALNPQASILANTPTPLSPGEILAVLLTGACVLGEKPALMSAEGRQMEPYPGAETMVEITNVCLSMVEQWGYIEDGGATQEAWDWVLSERLAQIPEGQECADYCRQYFSDWRSDLNHPCRTQT